jgi:hypothetical protein
VIFHQHIWPPWSVIEGGILSLVLVGTGCRFIKEVNLNHWFVSTVNLNELIAVFALMDKA